MTEQLTRFRVRGLHGSRTMDVRIERNTLVLVGENGTGKSTFANLMYYFLTRQWSRLSEYRFESITADFGDESFTLEPKHLEESVPAREHLVEFTRYLSMRPARHRVHQLLDSLVDLDLDAVALEERLINELDFPASITKDIVARYVAETKKRPTRLQSLAKRLSERSLGQYLYLPTYRRIEHDLRSIFRGVEIEEELRKFRDRLRERKDAPYIELVEFGMEDVEQTIRTRMESIKEEVRNGLDNLTGTYLRDVLRGAYERVNVDRINEIDPSSLDAVFERIEEATLPAAEKRLLKERVASISNTHQIREQDKVIAHFLLKLIDLYREQQANEKSVRDFVAFCNRYLSGKQIIYDNSRFTIYVGRDSEAGRPSDNLEMRSLSSGEKQIVSLFSHLFLSGKKKFFVIIDEPELSLSVPWQRQFLPDILRSGMCSGLIAVTHSPFVWDNDLEQSVRALSEFTVPYSGQ